MSWVQNVLMIRKFFHDNRLTLTIALAALVILPLLAALVSSNDSTPITPTAISVVGVPFPKNYRLEFTRYATVQRPDGTIRDLYINPTGLAAMRSYYTLPVGTVIVIEGYNALKNADGSFVTDTDGHFVKGEPLPAVHVREKRSYWTAADYTSSARNDGWNFGSFDANGAIYNESLNACFLCHNTAPADFTYSVQLIGDYLQSGEPEYFMCHTTGRTACE